METVGFVILQTLVSDRLDITPLGARGFALNTRNFFVQKKIAFEKPIKFFKPEVSESRFPSHGFSWICEKMCTLAY